MELLNPVMLWGALVISIPILLHFWHQKKGKVIEWAAMQWLIEKDLQQSKGIRLDNILLLILRCLLVLLLVLILSEPILNWLNNSDLSKKVHLVQANTLISDNFRFELEEAQKKGEKIYWINQSSESVKDIKQLPQRREFDAFILQSCINKIGQSLDNEQFELYFINSPILNKLGNIYVPNRFRIHSVVDSSSQTKPYLSFGQDNFLVVGSDNKLANSRTIEPKKYSMSAHSGELKFLFLSDDESAKKSFKAAINAIEEVYGVLYSIDFQRVSNKKYDLVFDSNSLKNGRSEVESVIEAIVAKFDLNPANQPLSDQQLTSIFKTEKQLKNHAPKWLNDVLFAVFLLILAAERWLSIKRNA